MQEHKKTKLVQASTIACSSSAMLEQHGSSRSTRSSRLARLARQSRTCRVESSRAKWNLGLLWKRIWQPVWRRPIGNGVGHINKVKLRRARLLLGLVTFGGSTLPVFSWALRPTQPGRPMVSATAVGKNVRVLRSSRWQVGCVTCTAAGLAGLLGW